MTIKEQVTTIQQQLGVSYKEARFMVKAFLRKQFEEGVITKEEWKHAKANLKEELK